jgi:replication factor C subunit 1
MKHIVLSGKVHPEIRKLINNDNYTIHRVLKPGYQLIVGELCNDGRPITESYYYKKAMALGIQIIRDSMLAPHLVKKAETELLVDKYAPKALAEVIGHKEQIAQMVDWLTNWPERGTAIFISGPPGIGKSTTAHLVVKHLGYKVSEYNASDTRSASSLRATFDAGSQRLHKEVIVMDEIDGISDRGGVGEIARIIRSSYTPIICISNSKAPKMKPIMNICLDIKFSRPVKSTIAGALEKISKKEGLELSKYDLEQICERNGNDIRSIINNMHFYSSSDNKNSNIEDKDYLLRLDAFSATQKLFGNRGLSIDDAINHVFVDYSMIPLMVSEAYLPSSRGSLEDCVKAAERVSFGDIMSKKIHVHQDWSLLPQYAANTVAVAKIVKGPPPFNIFPAWLGKRSKQMKHTRMMQELSRKLSHHSTEFRLDICDLLYRILLGGDAVDVKYAVKRMFELGLTRDDLMEIIDGVLLEKIEIPTKVKTALTREYNKIAVDDSAVKKIKGAKKGTANSAKKGADIDLGKGGMDEGEDDREGELEADDDEYYEDSDDDDKLLGFI